MLPYSYNCLFCAYCVLVLLLFFFFFFFNDTATTDIYTLSLHDALPILLLGVHRGSVVGTRQAYQDQEAWSAGEEYLPSWLDRKSTRLNSSHTVISYAVFCLKKKKKNSRSYRRWS